MELEEYLRGLGLQTEEFNQVSVAGRTTTERLQEMLDRARFAFLIMAAEDELKSQGKRARQNVVHEIGLFQGRLGFKRAIILKEKRCAAFSNIDGLTYIEFPRGRLDDEARRQIADALRQAGLID